MTYIAPTQTSGPSGGLAPFVLGWISRAVLNQESMIGAAPLGVLERCFSALVGVVVGDRAVPEQAVEPVEGAVPAGEDVAAAGGDQLVLQRTARGDYSPLEVLLAPQVAGCRRSATDLVEDRNPSSGDVSTHPSLFAWPV